MTKASKPKRGNKPARTMNNIYWPIDADSDTAILFNFDPSLIGQTAAAIAGSGTGYSIVSGPDGFPNLCYSPAPDEGDYDATFENPAGLQYPSPGIVGPRPPRRPH